MKAAVIQCADYFPRKKKISLKVSFDVSINYLNDRIYLGFPPNRISINSLIVVIIAISIIIITTIFINIIIVILILSCTTFRKPVYFYFIWLIMNVQNFGKLPIKTVLVFLKSCHSFDMAIRKKQIQRSSSLRPNICSKRYKWELRLLALQGRH